VNTIKEIRALPLSLSRVNLDVAQEQLFLMQNLGFCLSHFLLPFAVRYYILTWSTNNIFENIFENIWEYFWEYFWEGKCSIKFLLFPRHSTTYNAVSWFHCSISEQDFSSCRWKSL